MVRHPRGVLQQQRERWLLSGCKPPVRNCVVNHLPGQKLRLGGDALGADPTYLLYLPSRSRGGI